MSYVLVWSQQDRERETNFTWSPRPYASDAAAKRAATRIFKTRTADANDELMIYEGRRDAWGEVDYDHSRYVGKIAYDPLGSAVIFVPAGAVPNGERQ